MTNEGKRFAISDLQKETIYHSLGTLSRRLIDDIFMIFFQKIGSDILSKLPQMETVYMKCQILFPGENKKNISIYHLLKIYPEC